MSSCGGCKKRTTTFCYDHQTALCDDCIMELPSVIYKPESAMQHQHNCTYGNYYDWLSSPEFERPVTCTVCNHILSNSREQITRLVCKCMFHAHCFAEHVNNNSNSGSPLSCSKCNVAVLDSTQSQSKLRANVEAIVTAIKSRAAANSVASAAPAASSQSQSFASTHDNSSDSYSSSSSAAQQQQPLIAASLSSDHGARDAPEDEPTQQPSQQRTITNVTARSAQRKAAELTSDLSVAVDIDDIDSDAVEESGESKVHSRCTWARIKQSLLLKALLLVLFMAAIFVAFADPQVKEKITLRITKRS